MGLNCNKYNQVYKINSPGRKSTIGKTPTEEKKESRNIKKDLKLIGSICHLCLSKIGQQIDSADKHLVNLKITRINSLYETEIEELSESAWTKKRYKDLKTW